MKKLYFSTAILKKETLQFIEKCFAVYHVGKDEKIEVFSSAGSYLGFRGLSAAFGHSRSDIADLTLSADCREITTIFIFYQLVKTSEVEVKEGGSTTC